VKIGDLVKATPSEPNQHSRSYTGIVVKKQFTNQLRDTAINWLHLNIGVGYFHEDEWEFEILSEVKTFI